MNGKKRKRSEPAEEASALSFSLSPATVDVAAMPPAEFDQLKKAAEAGELTEPQLEQLNRDRKRAAAKRKNRAAIGAGSGDEARSASAREQAILQLQYPYTLSGVRSRAGQKLGALGAAKMARDKGSETQARVHALASQFLAAGTEKRAVSAKIFNRTGLSVPQILHHLRSHPSGLWKKKIKQP